MSNDDQKQHAYWGIWLISVVLVFFCIIVYSGRNNAPKESKAVSSKTEAQHSGLTTGQKNALDSANSYIRHSAFSHDGLIDQLEYEGYTTAEATFAADNCGADWNDEALQKAKSYLKHSAFSQSGLIEQLEYEKFTTEQATYAVSNCGADWKEQAAKCAESYLKHSSFSRERLIDQLIYEGFTRAQAVYGVEANGY